MDYKAELQKTIDFIEQNIKEPLDAKTLADSIGFSKRQYYRLFGASVGMPVEDYIRKRKLSHAIRDIMLGNRILNVALEYGFASHNGFAKAFKRQFGLSPQKYMSHAAAVVPQPINLFQQSEKYNIYGGVIMEPKIVHKSAFQIAGYGIKTNGVKRTKDCPALWDQYNIEGWEEKLYAQLQPKVHGEYGVCWETNMETGEFVYLIGVAVDDASRVTDDMVKVNIPETEYAVFTTPPADDADFSRNIRNTWRYILEEWLPNSGYEWDETKPDFELYDERCHGEMHKVMNIYIPVVKKDLSTC